MSTARIILPPIAVLAESAAALVTEANGNRARVNALNKAALALYEGVAPTPTHDGFLIESRTRTQVHRVSSVHGCGCEAGQAGRCCWHQGLLDIIIHAQARAIPLADRIAAARRLRAGSAWSGDASKRAAYEAACAAMDELFA